MHRHFLLFSVLIFAFLSAPRLSAQRILPDHFASWTSHGRAHEAENRPYVVLWPRSPEWAKYDSHPEYTQLLLESGVARIEEHYYQKGDAEIAIRAFELRDPSSAYEVYTSRLKFGMMPTNLGQVSALDKNGDLIQVGNLVLDSTANVSKEDLSDLVRAVEGRSGKAPLPPILAFLPLRGRGAGTERYALGPAAFRASAAELNRGAFTGLTEAVGFGDGAEAILAQYRSGKEEAVLLLLEYPTPQLAVYHQKHLELGLTEISKLEETPIERRGSLLMMVLSPSSPGYAERLRNSVNYETQVTWNEPTHTITDPPWTSVIARIFIGTGIFMVAAVVLGIAFGGVRVVTKIFLPGKVFDRPERMEILQLGLSGKKIDPSDFY
jgi:hypothetical protein